MNLGNRFRALGRSVGLVVFIAVWVGTCALAVTNRPAKPSDLARGAPDANCTGVVLVSSQEKSELLAKLAYEYDHLQRDCRTDALISASTRWRRETQSSRLRAAGRQPMARSRPSGR